MSSPRRRFLLILVIVLLSLFFALPREIYLPQGKTLELPGVSLSLGRFSFNRDLNLSLGLDLAGGSHLAFEADMEKLQAGDREVALEGTRATIERRVNLFGVSEAQVQTSRVGDSYRVIVELPGVKDTQQAINLIGETAKLDFREVSEESVATTEATPLTLANTKSTGFTGADFKRARPAFDPNTGKPIISFETKPESAEKFGEITTRLVGKQLAIFLDDIPISAPIVNVPITEGSGQITGNFTTEGTSALANLLNSGALPVPVHLIEQRTVEASLGAESVQKSVLAGLIGLSAVVLFMTAYYGRLGFLASLALLVYGILTLAVYKLIPVVLTLPGVAGFILSVGMAVDANILIFERMKEELRTQVPWQDAMEAGFGRAWDSIRDANIATLLTVFILFNPLNWHFLHVSGPVRGFALTLGLGILISLFTGVFVTRTLLRVFAKK